MDASDNWHILTQNSNSCKNSVVDLLVPLLNVSKLAQAAMIRAHPLHLVPMLSHGSVAPLAQLLHGSNVAVVRTEMADTVAAIPHPPEAPHLGLETVDVAVVVAVTIVVITMVDKAMAAATEELLVVQHLGSNNPLLHQLMEVTADTLLQVMVATQLSRIWARLLDLVVLQALQALGLVPHQDSALCSNNTLVKLVVHHLPLHHPVPHHHLLQEPHLHHPHLLMPLHHHLQEPRTDTAT
jgi:hypothetical protein